MGAFAGSQQPWTLEFESRCERLIEIILNQAPNARNLAWRELMTCIGPHIERWARESYVLRRCKLNDEDDARTVLVNVLAKLQSNDFGNLRRYLERRDPGEAIDRVESSTLSCIMRLTSNQEAGEEESPAADQTTDTPLRAWMLTLVAYTIKDHVRQRLGWSRPNSSSEQGVSSKRDLNTHAGRLDECVEKGHRPPMTDFLTMQRFVAEVMEFLKSFPPDMRKATTLWLQEDSFDEIANKLGNTSADSARALVRAAKARLRERFRGQWDQHLHGIVG